MRYLRSHGGEDSSRGQLGCDAVTRPLLIHVALVILSTRNQYGENAYIEFDFLPI